ncbi:uncharacterized protein LOC106176474 isoform X1 [Lingula anatina]|uniref:Uncharacterized protein LOC106176474 isoform X1 n=1 Tax=Lingula anatina TaxID=7574 RepID=A0A2R2MLL5_LINAN|nr:uncharacterized protein LOC106176474 isoform X1 [Lingula anatina]|eukprot:XP_023931099.1 uncharacterized protein LOC106176474 isoform X1 [Lingula anatina]
MKFSYAWATVWSIVALIYLRLSMVLVSKDAQRSYASLPPFGNFGNPEGLKIPGVTEGCRAYVTKKAQTCIMGLVTELSGITAEKGSCEWIVDVFGKIGSCFEKVVVSGNSQECSKEESEKFFLWYYENINMVLEKQKCGKSMYLQAPESKPDTKGEL